MVEEDNGVEKNLGRSGNDLSFNGAIKIILEQEIKEIFKVKSPASILGQMVTTLDDNVHQPLCIRQSAAFLALVFHQEPGNPPGTWQTGRASCGSRPRRTYGRHSSRPGVAPSR